MEIRIRMMMITGQKEEGNEEQEEIRSVGREFLTGTAADSATARRVDDRMRQLARGRDEWEGIQVNVVEIKGISRHQARENNGADDTTGLDDATSAKNERSISVGYHCRCRNTITSPQGNSRTALISLIKSMLR